MTIRPNAADFNRLFRGRTYGTAPIFTARSYEAFVAANDIDLARAICRYDGDQLIGALAYGIRGERAWFGLIGVLESRRRDGIGRDLFVRACEAVRATGATRIELETVHRNRAAYEMVAAHGFAPEGELHVWSRKARSNVLALPHAVHHSEEQISTMMLAPPGCWQREPASIARSGALHALKVSGAYALLRVRREHAMVVDAQAPDELSAHTLLQALDRRVPFELTLNNEPSDSALAAALRESDWRVVERQHRIVGR